MKSLSSQLLLLIVAFGLFATGCATPLGNRKSARESESILKRWKPPALDLKSSLNDRDSYPTAVAPNRRTNCQAGTS